MASIEQQDRFEGWAKARGFDLHKLKHTGGYRSALTADAWAAYRFALTPPDGWVLVPTRVLKDAHSFVHDKIHWEGGDRGLLNALSDLVK